MNVRTLILAILSVQEASGYEIKKMSSEGRFSYFVDISFGSIYPTLARLEAEGLVTCRAEAQSGKPDRKVYAITPRGHVELVQGLMQPPKRDKYKSEFLLVAMNAELAGPRAIERAIDDRIGWLEGEMSMLAQFLTECHQPATEWVVRYGMAVMENDLSYLRQNRAGLIAIARSGQADQAAE